jgi:hypothetical protein
MTLTPPISAGKFEIQDKKRDCRLDKTDAKRLLNVELPELDSCEIKDRVQHTVVVRSVLTQQGTGCVVVLAMQADASTMDDEQRESR